MIICFLGGIGSGKTLSVVKEIIDKQQLAYINFDIKNFSKFHRIKISDVVQKSTKAEGKKVKESYAVNWDYWEKAQKQGDFSIYLDELHNIIHARRSMSRINILMSKWVSQVRKILNDHPKNNLYLISQTERKIDIDFLELTQLIIKCQKIQSGGKTWVYNSYYEGYEKFMDNRRKLRTRFCADPYFKYYDYLKLVRFTDAEVYL